MHWRGRDGGIQYISLSDKVILVPLLDQTLGDKTTKLARIKMIQSNTLQYAQTNSSLQILLNNQDFLKILSFFWKLFNRYLVSKS